MVSEAFFISLVFDAAEVQKCDFSLAGHVSAKTATKTAAESWEQGRCSSYHTRRIVSMRLDVKCGYLSVVFCLTFNFFPY